MKVFVSGGCKNGKSFYAQRLAKDAAHIDGGISLPLYYIATMRPVDSEDDARIARHIDERDGWGFATVEQYERIEEILLKCDCGGSFLLDSLTALLAEEMFRPDGRVDEQAAVRIVQGLTEILDSVSNIVIVSDYIYSDAAVFDPLTELYRKSLAMIDRVAAEMCDVVLEVAYAGVTVHKGKDVFRHEACV
ncbi:MAG: bifunctional adenosylcobinamide kinase/adenosylcobinamide-phosphate guanylyltransferase [Oscillospiraceae bacterium]|nr:bifunctional adenosylcobinamide kinase/adenosylcobinamide-phosphate guanylyltransferase [Oscillospiraceae bacterium]